MLNNLLRCDLSAAQLEALAEAKGGWWLLEDDYFSEDDILIKEWGGFKFYQTFDLFGCTEDELPPVYVLTPEGYFLAADPSVLEEFDEEEGKEATPIDQLEKRFEEICEDAIATLLQLPEKLGQLSLFGTNNHV